MGWFNRTTKPAPPAKRSIKPNPHTNPRVRSAGFYSNDVGRLLTGWDTTSNSIDYHLREDLRSLRARSRRMVRSNPYGKRFISTMKSNVVGPSGVVIQAQTMRFAQGKLALDTPANDAVEAAFRDWAQMHCDYLGKSDWVGLQNLAISSAGQDGEFLFQKKYGKAAGKYGFQLKAIDPELLDVEKNTTTKNGEIRLGVEYDKTGRVIQFHFKKRSANGHQSGYGTGETYAVPARDIIHGYINEWPDQSRGVPWMHASLERNKHLEKYDEAAIVNARAGANTATVLRSDEEQEGFEGDTAGEGKYDDATLQQLEPGSVVDIGTRHIESIDPDYPHQMYDVFVKTQLRAIASGMGISYHSLSGDLEGVNYSSIRSGVMEDREIYKGIQNWFVRGLIRPVYEEWINNALLVGALKIGTRPLARPPVDYYPAHYQPRRWAWVDPLKDGQANKLAVDARTKSLSQIMRDQGDDPETTWREIAREQDYMNQLGITPPDPTKPVQDENEDEKTES